MAFDIDSKPGYGPAERKAPDAKAAARVASGKAPQPASLGKTDAELGIDEGPKAAPVPLLERAAVGASRAVEGMAAPGDYPINTEGMTRAQREDPIRNDPIAQTVVAAPLAAGAAALVAPAVAAAGAPALVAQMAGGAAGGAVGAGVTEQNPLTGAAIGAALPLAGAAAKKALAPWAEGAARRTAERVVTEWGQAAEGAGKAKTQAALMRLDPEKTATTLADNGIGLRGQSAAEAQAAQRAALARTGQELGSARDAIDAADPARKTVGDAMKAVEDKINALRSGPRANPPLADAIHGWSKDYLQAQGGAPGAALSVKDISQTISALEEKGYGGMGARLPGGDAKKAARIIAGALNEVLDDHIKAVSANNPAAAAAAKELAAKTAEYRVLKTVQPIIDQRAVAERFAPSAAQAVAKDPVKAARNALAGAATAPFRGAPGAVDATIAKLFAAQAAGQMTPQLIQQAERAGVSALVLQHFLRPAEQR